MLQKLHLALIFPNNPIYHYYKNSLKLYNCIFNKITSRLLTNKCPSNLKIRSRKTILTKLIKECLENSIY